MNFPKLPASGGKLPALWATVQRICDVLPSLEVYGDNSTTFVSKSRGGTVIRSRAKPVGGMSASVPDYRGPWSFSVEEDNGRMVLTIKGGFFVRNGICLSTFHKRKIWFDITECLTPSAKPRYIYIKNSFRLKDLSWDEPKVHCASSPPPESVSVYSSLDGYAMIGEITKAYEEDDGPDTLPKVVCYNLALPVMTVAGRCQVEEP